MPGQFRSAVWDPVLIVSQIVAMQAVFYVTLGFWVVVVDFILGNYRSLDQLFGYQMLHFKDVQGRFMMVAFFLNALTGALTLWYVVQRTKQCWDYATTTHIVHLVVCWMFTGYFPNTISWWLTTIISVISMTVLGEFLCMRTEMKAIPLSVGPKVDL